MKLPKTTLKPVLRLSSKPIFFVLLISAVFCSFGLFFPSKTAHAENSSNLSIFSLLNPLSPFKTTEALSLSYASVNYGPVGTSVTLAGTGFSAKSNTVNIGKSYKVKNIAAKSQKELTFVIPKGVRVGRYDLSVSVAASENGLNAGKTSDTVPFMVTKAGAPLPIIEKIEFQTGLEATFGKKITITGQNFTPKDNIVSTNVGIVSGVPSSDGKTLTFTLPAPDYLKNADAETRKKWFVSNGVMKDNLHWPVWVRIVNTNGPSTRPEASKFLINI